MIPPLVTGPIPPYNNPPIEPGYYQPRYFYISNISIGSTTLVTTSVDHDYVVGQQCRLIIPKGYGCTQLNEMDGFVTSIPEANQVILTINSQNSNAFIDANLRQKPKIVPIGDVNTGYINPTGRVTATTNIPGSFINISPQ